MNSNSEVRGVTLVVTTSYDVRNFSATLCYFSFWFCVACATFFHYTFHKKFIL